MSTKYLIPLFIFSTFVICLQAKVISTFAIARHGAQYPRNDLYDGKETKAHRGQVTPVGLRQHYNLGTYLRQAYTLEARLIEPKYNPNNVRFFSSTYQRTLESSCAFINGLYPLGSGWKIPQQVTPDKLNPPYKRLFPKSITEEQNGDVFALNQGFTPVPVRPLDQLLDNCANYDDLLAKRNQQILAQIQVLQSQQRNQISRLAAIFNLSASQQNVYTIVDLYQTIYSDQYLGRPLPTSYTQSDHRNLKFMYQYYTTLLADGNFGRVLSTPLLRMLRLTLLNAVSQTNLKFTMVVAHRSNLMPLLLLLNLTNTDCLTQKWKGQAVKSLNCVTPSEFASSLIFQLHEDDSFQHFISIKYNGEYVYVCDRKQLKCSLQQFVSRIKVLETNYEQQCGIIKKKARNISQI